MNRCKKMSRLAKAIALTFALGPSLGLAGLCMILVQGTAQAQESRLGRLFYSPEERAKLDQKRGVVTTPSVAGTCTSTAPHSVSGSTVS